jgi:hypothetical protein
MSVVQLTLPTNDIYSKSVTDGSLENVGSGKMRGGSWSGGSLRQNQYQDYLRRKRLQVILQFLKDSDIGKCSMIYPSLTRDLNGINC